MISLSIARHNAFASRFDLSNMDQTLWYTLNGYFFQLRHPDEFVSRFSIHADIILVLLSPLYLLWDDVRMLIASESIILALGAIPVYLISRMIIKGKMISLIISSIYLINPGMQWTDLYDFHAVSFFITFFLFAFYFVSKSKLKLYWVFIFLSLITKENTALIISVLGVIVFLYFKKFKTGLLTIIIGITWFLTMVNVVMPYFTPEGQHWALAGYSEGDSNALVTIAKRNFDLNTITQKFVFDANTQEYYALLLRQYSFLPILGAPWLILSAPEIFINVLRGTTMITFHYDSAVLPGFVIAMIYGIKYSIKFLNKIPQLNKFTNFILTSVLIVALLYSIRVNYQYGPLPWTPWCQCYIYNVTKEDVEFENILQSIPKDASVTASLEIRPHVSHRLYAYTLPSATESADFIAIITQNRLISNYEKKDYENELIPVLLNSREHVLKHKSRHFYLFERIK